MRRDEREAAYTEFVVAHQGQLRRIACAICGDWTQADDLLQIALTKLYVAWPEVTRDGRERAYTRQIITRANVDEHRRPWRHEMVGLPDDGSKAGTQSPPATDDLPDVVAALQLLPLMQRRAVVLRHWVGLSVEETAAELGISTGTVKSHTARGIAHLQDSLSTEGI